MGCPPDERMVEHARMRGYELADLRARQFRTSDFEEFDLILTMDSSNFENVTSLTENEKFRAKVKPMTSYCKIHDIDHVPDPYYKNEDGFEHVLDILEDACEQLVNEIQRKIQ